MRQITAQLWACLPLRLPPLCCCCFCPSTRHHRSRRYATDTDTMLRYPLSLSLPSFAVLVLPLVVLVLSMALEKQQLQADSSVLSIVNSFIVVIACSSCYREVTHDKRTKWAAHRLIDGASERRGCRSLGARERGDRNKSGSLFGKTVM